MRKILLIALFFITLSFGTRAVNFWDSTDANWRQNITRSELQSQKNEQICLEGIEKYSRANEKESQSQNKASVEALNKQLLKSIPTADEPIRRVVPQAKNKKSLYMTVKTNALHDLALIPNIGLEFYLGEQWSIGGNWMYAWWKNEKKHYFWRIYGGDIEVRKWWGKAAESTPLTGHHIGIYGQLLTYDFELGGRGYMSNKWNYGGGVSYGYSLPVAKRLNLDFTIGVGYLGGEYFEYEPHCCYLWKATKQRHWFGPTKAEISLIWIIGNGIENKKGGRQ